MLKCGSMLHAQLEIWKAAVEESPRNTLAASWSPAGVVQSPNSAVTTPTLGSTTTAASVKGSPCAIDLSDGTLSKVLRMFYTPSFKEPVDTAESYENFCTSAFRESRYDKRLVSREISREIGLDLSVPKMNFQALFF